MTDAVTTGNVELMLPEEVAEYLRISKTSIYRLTEKRELPFIRVGGKFRFLKSDVLAYVARRRVVSAEWK